MYALFTIIIGTCSSLAEAGDCAFYEQCVQNKLGCDREKDYPMAYGYKYCNKFGEHYDSFTTEVSVFFSCVIHTSIHSYSLK